MLSSLVPFAFAGVGLIGLGAWVVRVRRGGGGSAGAVIGACLSAACVAAPAAEALTRPDRPTSAVLPGGRPGGWYTASLPHGLPAPDFVLPRAIDGIPVKLSNLVGRKPVVLVFGSFACEYVCARTDALRALYAGYKDRAEFLFVYITDAHPHLLPETAKRAIDRAGRARAGAEHYDLSIPCVIDTDGAAERAYDAFPAKLVIVDLAGRVAFDSGRVMVSGFNPTAAAAWLDAHTARKP